MWVSHHGRDKFVFEMKVPSTYGYTHALMGTGQRKVRIGLMLIQSYETLQ